MGHETKQGRARKHAGPSLRGLVIGAALLTGSFGGTAAQEIDPEPTAGLGSALTFQPLLADPLEPRTGVTFLRTDLFDRSGRPAERPAFDLPEGRTHRSAQASASFGQRFTVWGGRVGPTSIAVGIQAGVFARFRLDTTTNDMIGSDWTVAFPLEVGVESWSARLRLVHWSSHLGDEFTKKSAAERVGFSFEAVDMLVARELLGDRLRLYGGGSLVLRSQADALTPAGKIRISNQGQVQAGFDVRWRPLLAGHLGLVAGADWQRADITDWQNRFSGMVGWELRRGQRRLEVLARLVDGPSQMGQFFLTTERFTGVEVRFGL